MMPPDGAGPPAARSPGGRFAGAVERVVRSLGPGEVASYGEVAEEAGRPGAARAVGNVLAGCDGALPWWRVVHADGRLAPGKEVDQARRLRAEGVDVREGRVRRRSTRPSQPGASSPV